MAGSSAAQRMRNARLALQKPADYDVRAEIMWAGTLSHNDITGTAVRAIRLHQLEHEWQYGQILLTAQALQRSGAASPLCAQQKLLPFRTTGIAPY